MQLLVALFALPLAHAISSAVLGIDLGTENIKASLVKPGVPLDIVLTKDSKRKETAAIAFKPIAVAAGQAVPVNTSLSEDYPERVYGSDAIALSARFPKDVYASVKSLIGHSKSLHQYRPELRITETNGSVGFQSASFTADEPEFSVEELLAMQLKNIRANANAMGGKGFSVNDAVITVPSFYTTNDRRAVLVAAELAGLRVLSLISDGLAIALNFATPRTFPTVNATSKAEIHLIYDMGAGSTTATVVEFFSESVKDYGKVNKTIQHVQVLATAWDTTLGGDALNAVVVEDMLAAFEKQTGLGEIRQHGRSMSKIVKEAQRVRQVLSANAETSAFFEALFHDDVDFKYSLSRNSFEQMTESYAQRVQSPILQALKSANLTVSDLDSLIVHGGAVRTPFVQRELESLVGSEKVRNNVNSDEAAVFGAGFKAATISPSFRVKEIKAVDIAGYPLTVTWDDREEHIFDAESALGVEQDLVLNPEKEVGLELSQTIPIAFAQTHNWTESVAALTNKSGCLASNVSTNLTFRLDPTFGFPEIKASVSCWPVEAERKGVVDGVKGLFGFGKKEDQQPLMNQTANVTKPHEKKKLLAIPLNVTMTPLIEHTKNLTRIRKRLVAWDASDRSRVLREETFNNLEGYAYKIRDTLEDSAFVAVSTGGQREEIEALASEISSWLYGEGASANREALKTKMDGIRRLVTPIEKRKKEAASRPGAVQGLRDAIKQASSMLDLMRQQNAVSSMFTSEVTTETDSQSSTSSTESSTSETSSTSTTTSSAAMPVETTTLTEEELQSIVDLRDAAESWLNKTMAEQDALDPTENPVIQTTIIEAKSKELGELVTKMLMKQMRAPRAKPKPKTSKKTSSTATAESSAAPKEAGEWDAEPKMPTTEEQEEMFRKQDEIDRQLAAEKAAKTGQGKSTRTSTTTTTSKRAQTTRTVSSASKTVSPSRKTVSKKTGSAKKTKSSSSSSRTTDEARHDEL